MNVEYHMLNVKSKTFEIEFYNKLKKKIVLQNDMINFVLHFERYNDKKREQMFFANFNAKKK